MNQLVNQTIVALCLGLPIGMATLSSAEVPIQRPAEEAHTERVNFSSGGTIRFNDSFGDLFIEGWDQPFVESTLIKELRNYAAPSNVPERLEGVQFTTEHPSANELKISTTVPSVNFFRHPLGGKGDVTVRYEMHVPRDSHLVIQHGGGNILIDNVTGGIEAHNRNGDIVVMLPAPGPYSIDAKSRLGTVTSDFSGKARVRYLVGERLTNVNNSAAHAIHLRVGIGGITIKEMAPEAEP